MLAHTCDVSTRMWRPGDQEFKVSPSYTSNLKQALATQDPVSKNLESIQILMYIFSNIFDSRINQINI